MIHDIRPIEMSFLDPRNANRLNFGVDRPTHLPDRLDQSADYLRGFPAAPMPTLVGGDYSAAVTRRLTGGDGGSPGLLR